MELARQVAEQFLVPSVECLIDFDEQALLLELGNRGPNDRLGRRRHFVFHFGDGFERIQFHDINPQLINHHALKVQLHVDGAVVEPDVVIRLLGIDRDEVTPTVTERFAVKSIRRHDQTAR